MTPQGFVRNARIFVRVTLILAICAISCRSAFADSCTQTTLNNLVGGGSCTIGTLQFSNFGFVPQQTGITASDIVVTPITSQSFGFTFADAAGFTQPAGGFGVGMLFEVTEIGTTNLINGIALNVGPATTGTGSNSFVFNALCLGAGNFFAGPHGTASCVNPSPSTTSTLTVLAGASGKSSFDPVSALDFNNAVLVQAGASYSSFSEQFSETPVATTEPSSFMLLVAGLSGLLVVTLKKAIA